MKTRIYAENSDVVVEYDDEFTNERRSDTYFVPHNGGYVRLRDTAQQYPQVCVGLSTRGPTLYCKDPDDLLDLIRRENRRAKRIDRALMNRPY